MANKNQKKFNCISKNVPKILLVIVILATIDMGGMFSPVDADEKNSDKINKDDMKKDDIVRQTQDQQVVKHTRRFWHLRKPTDRHAANAIIAGDIIAGAGEIMAAASLATGPLMPFIAAAGSAVTAAGFITHIIARAADQSCREFGCYKGYCWARCSIGNQSCYTTQSRHSQSYRFVKCSKDSDCNGCWKCGGPCVWRRMKKTHHNDSSKH